MYAIPASDHTGAAKPVIWDSEEEAREVCSAAFPPLLEASLSCQTWLTGWRLRWLVNAKDIRLELSPPLTEAINNEKKRMMTCRSDARWKNPTRLNLRCFVVKAVNRPQVISGMQQLDT